MDSKEAKQGKLAEWEGGEIKIEVGNINHSTK